jgi:hypothetical protein
LASLNQTCHETRFHTAAEFASGKTELWGKLVWIQHEVTAIVTLDTHRTTSA